MAGVNRAAVAVTDTFDVWRVRTNELNTSLNAGTNANTADTIVWRGDSGEIDVSTLSANVVTLSRNSTAAAITVASGKYLGFTHRTGDTNINQVRCGTGVNEISVCMNPSTATSLVARETRTNYENSAGKQENFYVYASKISLYNIHSTTFTTLTSSTPKNYIFWGYDAESSGYDDSFLEAWGDWDSYNKDSCNITIWQNTIQLTENIGKN